MTGQLVVQAVGDRAITFTRDFAAPRPLVWRAMTDPALVMRWLWTQDHPMTRCEQDLRVGGALRWEWAMPGGAVMGVSGTYLQIEPPGLIVHSELFDEDWTGGATRVTTVLDDCGPALTRMRMTAEYSGTAARDRVMLSPMAEGMDEGYARLDTLLPAFA